MSDHCQQITFDDIVADLQAEREIGLQLRNQLKIIKAQAQKEQEQDTDIITKLRTRLEEILDDSLMEHFHLVVDELQEEREKLQQLQQQFCAFKKEAENIQIEDAELIEELRMQLSQARNREEKLKQLLREEQEKSEELRAECNLDYVDDTSLSKLKLAVGAIQEIETTESSERLVRAPHTDYEKACQRVNDLQRMLHWQYLYFERELSDHLKFEIMIKEEFKKLTEEKNSAENELKSLRANILATIGGRKAGIIDRDEKMFGGIPIKDSVCIPQKYFSKSTSPIKYDTLDNQAYPENVSKLKSSLTHFSKKLKKFNHALKGIAKENVGVTNILKEGQQKQNDVLKLLETIKISLNRKAQYDSSSSDSDKYLLRRKSCILKHNKSLIYQKKYLTTMLTAYERDETLIMKILNLTQKCKKKTISFRYGAFTVIAVLRLRSMTRKIEGNDSYTF